MKALEVATTVKADRCTFHPESIASFILTPELTHYGKYVCAACGRFLCWVKKPDGEKRDRRSSVKLQKPFHAAGIDYCQVCLRKRCELPPNVTFVAHHVVEVRDGGTDNPSNLWHVCTICHEFIHLMRRNRHMKDDRPCSVPEAWDYET